MLLPVTLQPDRSINTTGHNNSQLTKSIVDGGRGHEFRDCVERGGDAVEGAIEATLSVVVAEESVGDIGIGPNHCDPPEGFGQWQQIPVILQQDDGFTCSSQSQVRVRGRVHHGGRDLGVWLHLGRIPHTQLEALFKEAANRLTKLSHFCCCYGKSLCIKLWKYIFLIYL